MGREGLWRTLRGGELPREQVAVSVPGSLLSAGGEGTVR